LRLADRPLTMRRWFFYFFVLVCCVLFSDAFVFN
jgi:hypothetical protein